jgi:magnesium chelatase family protein
MVEFGPAKLNLMGQPLDDGRVTIVPIHGTATFPARFMLAGAMNPCPCGLWSGYPEDIFWDRGSVQRPIHQLSPLWIA